MTDYEALIKAVLDTSDVESKIKSLQNQKISLTLDIKSGNTDINSFIKNLESQMKTSGQNAGASFSDGLNNGMKKSLGGGANTLKQETKEITNTFNEMKSIAKKIGTVEKEFWKADTKGNQPQTVENAKRQLEELNARYKELEESTAGKKLSASQTNTLDSIFKNNWDSLENLDAKLADTSAIKQRETALQQLLNLQSQIKQTSVDLIKAESGGNQNSATQLREELERLLATYNELRENSKDILSPEQMQTLSNAVNETEEKIRLLRNQLQDKLELKISADEMKSQIDGIKGKFDELTGTAKNLNLDIDTSKMVSDLKELDDIQAKIASGDLSVEEKAAAYAKYDEIIKRVGSSMKEYQKTVEDAARSNEKIAETMAKSETLSNQMSAWLSENKHAAREYGQAIAELQEKLRNNPGDAKVYQEVAEQFRSIQAQARSAGSAIGDFGTKIASTVKMALGLTSVFAIFQRIKRVVKEMYQNVVDIDTAMTNLYKVTDETPSKYAEYLSQAKADAQELGRTVSDMIEQTSTWAKLGYSLNDSSILAKVSSIYANVGEISNETAVSDLVTAMKAFKIEAKDAMTIVDPLNELGNKFATSAGDLGAGLTKSASTLQLAGASLNEALAMLTGGAEITQNAQEFGNAIKVGAMRVRGMKGELEELGEEVDDNVESFSKMQTQILNLTHGKVNIFDSNGDFRDIYNIYKDIAEVFDSLKSTEQADLIETLFGKVRGNQGMALISAFQSGQVQKALETANHSSGSAAEEQKKWMESLEAKTNQLKAAWQGLSETFLSSDFLKHTIDAGTSLLNIVTKLVDTFGTIPTLLGGAGIIGLIKNFGLSKINIVPIFYSEPIYIKETA